MRAWIRVASLLPLLLMSWSCGDQPDVYSVSMPHLKVDQDWTIVGMDLKMNAASVEGVQNIPLGWTFTITDGSEWQTQIKGVCNEQAAALTPEEVKKIVFLVRKNEGPDSKFDIGGTYTTTKSFDNGKLNSVTMQDFSMGGNQ
jgi:hypothetical protein